MTKKAKITGVKREVAAIDYIVPKTLDQKFELKSYIEVSSTRSENIVNEINFEENDLVALQFTDDTEWIGHPEDVQAIAHDVLRHRIVVSYEAEAEGLSADKIITELLSRVPVA